MTTNNIKFQLPERALKGIRALISLGSVGVSYLAKNQANQELDLDLSRIYQDLAEELQLDPRNVHRAIVDALIPLNGLRRSLEISTSEFLEAITQVIAQAPASEQSNYANWSKLLPILEPLFQPDNFFSQASRAFELMAQRPAVYQETMILTEHRPIYSEDTTKIVCTLLSNTLILKFWSGHSEKSVHVTMDMEDLDELQAVLDRARKKCEVSKSEAEANRTNLVSYKGASNVY